MAKLADVADFFINYSQKTNEPMTNLRLNKLLYFAYGLHLLRVGQALFDASFEAWSFGPVVPEVYNRYKKFDGSSIDVPEAAYNRDCFSDSEYESLIETARLYGQYSTYKLVSISHEMGGAWANTRQNKRQIITDELIVADFERQSPGYAELSYDKLLEGKSYSYSANGVLILPKEDGDDEYWPEYDDI
jgi:uncharacterized phage-associated protein